MIRHLKGDILKKELTYTIVDVSGVGYQVFISPATSGQLSGPTAELWVHMAVRETSMELFGFRTEQELLFFEMLISVSGVGPRSALSITAVAAIETLKKAIAAGDISHLTGVSGIGKRTAEKIVVELKDKMSQLGFSDEDGSLQKESDVIEALVALGYTRQVARDAMRNIEGDDLDTNEKIRAALKNL